jgi:hypothetical protein
MTSQEYRVTADAVEAWERGKPVEVLTNEKWEDETCPPSQWGWMPRRPKPQVDVVPWTMETCPPLPFEVRHKNKLFRAAVLYADGAHSSVSSYGSVTWNRLMQDFTLANGDPCGTKQ